MSVVTIAFFGIAFSSSRSARRGAIGEPSAWPHLLSSASQASFCFFTSRQARGRGWRAPAIFSFEVCEPRRISAAAGLRIAADADADRLDQAEHAVVAVDLDDLRAASASTRCRAAAACRTGPSRVPSASTTSAWAMIFIAAFEPW